METAELTVNISCSGAEEVGEKPSEIAESLRDVTRLLNELKEQNISVNILVD